MRRGFWAKHIATLFFFAAAIALTLGFVAEIGQREGDPQSCGLMLLGWGVFLAWIGHRRSEEP